MCIALQVGLPTHRDWWCGCLFIAFADAFQLLQVKCKHRVMTGCLAIHKHKVAACYWGRQSTWSSSIIPFLPSQDVCCMFVLELYRTEGICCLGV